MSNSLLTINMITNEAVRLFSQTNAFLRRVNRQYDDQFARTGAKIGNTLRIRLPNDYIVNTGPAITPQGTNEQNTSLTVATQKNVPVSFGTAEKTMSLDDYSETHSRAGCEPSCGQHGRRPDQRLERGVQPVVQDGWI